MYSIPIYPFETLALVTSRICYWKNPLSIIIFANAKNHDDFIKTWKNILYYCSDDLFDMEDNPKK